MKIQTNTVLFLFIFSFFISFQIEIFPININNNLFEVYYSRNKQNKIFTRAETGCTPELYIQIGQNTPQQITFNEYIEFSPVINNNGDFAYAISEYSTSVSKIFFNNKLIKKLDIKGLHKLLEINDNFLVFIYERLYDNRHFIYLFNISDNSLQRIPIKLIPQRLKFYNDTLLIMQVYSEASSSMDIFSFDINSQTVTPLLVTSSDELLTNSYLNNQFTFVQVMGKDNVNLLFNTYYSLVKYPAINQFSRTNDFMGRIAWALSYRLEALIKLYKITMDNEIKEQIQNIIYDLLLITNEYLNIEEDKYNPPFLWASKKYSMNRTIPISLMVTNSRILYPMLLACNSDLLEADQKLKIKIIAESMYNYFETYYDFENHLYKFQYGMNFNYDGFWLPFNQQNAFGLVLIELYYLTAKVQYKDRLTEIARKFKFEFLYAKDGRLLWKYWPEIYHNGWNIKSDISINCPEKHETVDTLYEDISHAGLSLKFILEFRKLDNTIFSDDVLCKINTTVKSFSYNNLFSRFISGNITYQPPNIRFLPKYAWAELKNPNINRFYFNLFPKIRPYFDSESSIVYISAIPEDVEFKNIEIKKYLITGNMKIEEAETIILTWDKLKEYIIENL